MDRSIMFARWRQCAPPTNTCFLGPTPSPYPKRHLERFSRFCTTHGRESLYFTMGCPFPLKIAPTHGGSGPHLIHTFWGHPSRCTNGLAVFVELMMMIDPRRDWQTDRPRYSVCNNRPLYVCSTVVWPKNAFTRWRYCLLPVWPSSKPLILAPRIT